MPIVLFKFEIRRVEEEEAEFRRWRYSDPNVDPKLSIIEGVLKRWTKKYQLSYTDEENDRILMNDEPEFLECLNVHREMQAALVRICVEEKHEGVACEPEQGHEPEQRQEQLRQEQEQLRQEQERLREEQLRQEQLRQEQERLRQEQEQLRQEQERLREEQLRQEQEQLRQEEQRQEQLRQEQERLRQEEQRQELRQEEQAPQSEPDAQPCEIPLSVRITYWKQIKALQQMGFHITPETVQALVDNDGNLEKVIVDFLLPQA